MKRVRFYTDAHAVVTVHFPEDRTVCCWCPFCVRDPDNGARRLCFLTRELLIYEEFGRGLQCPLILEGKEETCQL